MNIEATSCAAKDLQGKKIRMLVKENDVKDYGNMLEIDVRIAYCGVDCSVCPDYAEGKCPGCRLTEWKEDDICLPVRCCREKEITFCGECGFFPCSTMSDFYKESESHEKAFELMMKIRDKKAE